jgi:hypothetical protein
LSLIGWVDWGSLKRDSAVSMTAKAILSQTTMRPSYEDRGGHTSGIALMAPAAVLRSHCNWSQRVAPMGQLAGRLVSAN